MLATTTSTENSGLLSALLPAFKSATGISVQVIAVGSGKALKLGENGDVDIVLSHSPAAESAFVAGGFGVDSKKVMYNDFVIVGPATDPAGVSRAKDVREAFAAIARAKAVFISRGDESGTHAMEKSIWKAAGIAPEGAWYRSIGQGMSEALVMAGEKLGYTLSDRATFIALRSKVNLAVLFQNDPLLRNQYRIIAVNPAKHTHVHYSSARRLIDWLVSRKGQETIAAFTKEGEQLFFPSAQP